MFDTDFFITLLIIAAVFGIGPLLRFLQSRAHFNNGIKAKVDGLRFPHDGKWLIVGGGTVRGNHHVAVPAQTWAYDWCKLGENDDLRRNESEELLLKPETGTAGTDEEDEVNEVARDMLLRLPGVNVHNARRIMRECDSLAELAQMSRDDLRRIAGPVTGQKLFTFFRQTLAST